MHHILDLGRYPLHRVHSREWQELVARCRSALSSSGMFNLEGFVRSEVVRAVASSLTPVFDSKGFVHERLHNVYFVDGVPGVGDDHPALARSFTSNVTLSGDLLLRSEIDELYRWPEFAQFLAATLDKSELHCMDDILAGVNVMSYRAGQELAWHFDRAEFTTTLLLQAPERGGHFYYRTDLRSDHDANYEGIAAVIRGEDPKVERLTLQAGTLNVFRGFNTLHRVSKVEGAKSRMVSVLSFHETSAVRLSDEDRIGFYGRSETQAAEH